MHVIYSPDYEIDIGLHVFPTAKFTAVRRCLAERGMDVRLTFVEPVPATWEELAEVHTPAYLAKIRTGILSLADIAQLELPWSRDIVEGFRLMTGGTIEAARRAVAHGLAVHVGGGFHHAFAGHGEGFCMFNDIAVATRVLQHERIVERVAIVDCDVHHGNGTAAIFGGASDVFTFSMHQWNNYPAVKPPSTLDVHLPDGIEDEEYLGVLDGALEQVVEYRPDLAFYLAGADPFREDQLGGLSLTTQGLRRRDARVLRTLRRAGIDVAVTLAGGYARHVADTVAIHVGTVEEAIACEQGE